MYSFSYTFQHNVILTRHKYFYTKFNKFIINNISNDFHNNSLKKTFEKKKALLVTRQVKSSQNLLIRVRFDVVPKPIAPPKVLDFTTVKIKVSFYIDTTILIFAKNLNLYNIWKYNRYFDCKNRDVIYLIICINCEGTYIGETECLSERINNTKSSIGHANASSLPYTPHISKCRNLKNPCSKFTHFITKVI